MTLTEQENNFQGETIELMFDFPYKIQRFTGKRELPIHVLTSKQRAGHSLQLKNIVVVLNPGKLSLFYSVHEPLSVGYVQGNDNFV